METLLFNFLTGKWEPVPSIGTDKPFMKMDRQSALCICILYTFARKENPSTMKVTELDKIISDSSVYSKQLYAESISYAKRVQLVKIEGDDITMTEKGSKLFAVYLGWSLVTDNPFFMEFIRIPAGQFIIGKEFFPDDAPMREIYLDEYEIGKYPVTNREYAEFSGNLVGEPDHPVVNVSWYEAMEYCKWLSEKTNSTITLPTEAQFVKAARGGIWLDGEASKKVKNPLPKRFFPWGNDNPHEGYANYNKLSTTPVSMHYLGASPYGCRDMAGNVWQWCLDWYDSKFYVDMPSKNPVNEVKYEGKSMLGGYFSCNPIYMSVGYRGVSMPSIQRYWLGFRCVRLKGK